MSIGEKTMEKRTFRNQVSEYIKYFNQPKSKLNSNVEYMKKYCVTVLNTLAGRFRKEHPMENNFAFNKNIDVMKFDLLSTDFEDVSELVNEFLDDLEFLQNKFVYEPLLNSVSDGGAK